MILSEKYPVIVIIRLMLNDITFGLAQSDQIMWILLYI